MSGVHPRSLPSDGCSVHLRQRQVADACRSARELDHCWMFCVSWVDRGHVFSCLPWPFLRLFTITNRNATIGVADASFFSLFFSICLPSPIGMLRSVSQMPHFFSLFSSICLPSPIGMLWSVSQMPHFSYLKFLWALVLGNQKTYKHLCFVRRQQAQSKHVQVVIWSIEASRFITL